MKEDGVGGLFRGGGPTVVRAMALNMGMLASNDQAKEMIQAAGFEKGSMIPVIGGSLIAGAQQQRQQHAWSAVVLHGAAAAARAAATATGMASAAAGNDLDCGHATCDVCSTVYVTGC